MSATNLNRIAMLLAFAGIFVAGTLSLGHALKVEVPCVAGQDCARVTSHPSGFWFNQPVAYYGLAAYLALAFLAGMRSANGVSASRPAVLAGIVVSAIGTVASGYLTYMALFVIRGTCPWCLASAAIMAVLLIVHVLMHRALERAEPDPQGAADIDFKFMVALGIVSAMALVFTGAQLKEPRKGFVRENLLEKLTDEDLVPQDAHIIGSPDAPVTVVEFADLQCGMCRESYPHMVELANSSQGRVRVVFRHLPLGGPEHALATPGAIIAEMAGEKNRFFQYIDGVYKMGADLKRDDLFTLAMSHGLDPDVVKKRMSDPKDRAVLAVTRDIATAQKFLTPLTTPAFVVFKKGGRRYAPRNVQEIQQTLALPEFK